MTFKIGRFHIGAKRNFVIAEIGNNHNGSFDRAIEMIDYANEAGADCVKFQMRHLDQVYRKRSLSRQGEDLGTEYIIDLLYRFELSIEDHQNLANYCKQKDILYLCTPWDNKSVGILESFNVPAFKVASADLTNLPLLERLADTGKPLILSTGMSTIDELKFTIDFLNHRSVKFALLHCNSTYPAPFHDINLSLISELRKMHYLVGYSGHERGINVSLAAASLGSCIIERHFTLDRHMEGPDHAASLTPSEFAKMVQGIREIEEALGEGKERLLSQGEMINRENLGKSLVASTDLRKGIVLKPEHIKVRSPGQGLSPQHYDELIGQILCHDMDEEDFFFLSDLGETRREPSEYNFNRPWGIPVRFHDFKQYAARINPDLWEFHLSYSDMNLDPAEYLDGTYKASFIVHAPELFEGSKMMDLATPNNIYRNYSLSETQRVIDITRKLKNYFPNSKRPMIVANVGGFSMDAPLPTSEISDYYNRFAESLLSLDLDGVEIIPQTMAPFPWHFGGQRYQNIFVKIDEIIDWCSRLNLRMCFDTSHSLLACNHIGLNFYDFAEKIAPYTSHIHIGDAKGLNGEGLQLGDGEINFTRLGSILKKGCPTASFIPEIWQGHKNCGEGFWVALERLQGKL
jgi:sialic acid synthase SpsE/sugar phosphate isomerase/epimerase